MKSLESVTEGTIAGTGKNITLIISITASFILTFISSSVNIALPTIGKEFALEAVVMGWIASSFTLGAAALLVPFGRLADIYGRKKMLLYGMLLFVLSSFLCSISKSAAWLIAFRVLQGVSSGMTVGTAVAIVTSVFPAADRGKALGINLASVYFGLSVGPFFGGLLTEHFGWRSLFFASACWGLAVAILILWRMKGEWAEARNEKFDFLGSVTFTLFIVLTIYGFTVLPHVTGIFFIIAGLISMLVFIRWESRTASPIISLALFRHNRAFVFSNLAILINYSGAFATSFLLSLYLQYIKGMSPKSAGLVLIASPIVMAIFSPISGRLSDRVEPRLVAASGMGLLCLALASFAFIGEGTAVIFIIIGLAVFGLGMGFFSTPNTNAVMSSVSKKFFGVASGASATMRSCGMSLSLGTVMILFSLLIGGVSITPEYYPAFLTSMKVGFSIFAALCFAGIFIQLAGKKPESQ